MNLVTCFHNLNNNLISNLKNLDGRSILLYFIEKHFLLKQILL